MSKGKDLTTFNTVAEGYDGDALWFFPASAADIVDYFHSGKRVLVQDQAFLGNNEDYSVQILTIFLVLLASIVTLGAIIGMTVVVRTRTVRRRRSESIIRSFAESSASFDIYTCGKDMSCAQLEEPESSEAYFHKAGPTSEGTSRSISRPSYSAC